MKLFWLSFQFFFPNLQIFHSSSLTHKKPSTTPGWTLHELRIGQPGDQQDQMTRVQWPSSSKGEVSVPFMTSQKCVFVTKGARRRSQACIFCRQQAWEPYNCQKTTSDENLESILSDHMTGRNYKRQGLLVWTERPKHWTAPTTMLHALPAPQSVTLCGD